MSAATDSFLRARRAAIAAHPERLGLEAVFVEPDPADLARFTLEIELIAEPDNLEDKLETLVEHGRAALRFTVPDPDDATREIAVDGLFELEDLRVERGRLIVPLRFAGGDDLGRRLAEDPVFTLGFAGVPELDPFFGELSFSLDAGAPQPFEHAPPRPAAASAPPLAIDYLARDYPSFRQLMLEHLATRLPGWRERNPADPLVTLVELLADAADRVSYRQEAVETEAYLGTARRRISVRRHTRLVGYRLEEGRSARAWAQIEVDTDTLELPAGTVLLTRVPGEGGVLLPPGSARLRQALTAAPTVFETLHAATLRGAHNLLPLYDWGAPSFTLPLGATRATLRGSFPALKPGAVLIFEAVAGAATGLAEDARPEHRQAVRVVETRASSDPLGEDEPELTEIAWHPDDALRFPLAVASELANGAIARGLAAARGNVVLADHGERAESESFVVSEGRFRPRLARRPLAFCVPYDPASAESAAAVLDPTAPARPALTVEGEGEIWALRDDLLSSDPFEAAAVVEIDDAGGAVLRFGDGVLGRPPAPGSVLTARYRVGGGLAGNLGADTLGHVISHDPAILAVRNPLPARGGRDPESLDHARRAAPGRFAAEEAAPQERAARRAAEHPEVERAAAALAWNGSWHVLRVAVLRRGRMPIDDVFRAELRRWLEPERLAGWELAIDELGFVPLDVALPVVLEPGASRAQVERALLETFSNRRLAGGRRGFFHRDNFEFGESVYLSRVVEAALAVPGVRAVDLEPPPRGKARFGRFGEPPRGELETGQIRLSGLEIARVDNDPSAPENGRIEIFLEGGR